MTKQFVVVSPHGISWAVRFYTEDAAWRRLLALKGMRDTEESRAALAAAGWKIETREPVSA